jgi:3-methyladenine DNA glycosylase AlkC
MAEPLKNAYNKAFVDRFLHSCSKVIPTLNKQQVERAIFDSSWEDLELKQRMSRLATALQLFLDDDFPVAAVQLVKLSEQLLDDGHSKDAFEYMFLPEYIERKGLDYLSESLNCIEQLTQFTSCEFAIRPFIVRYPTACIEQMLKWSSHNSADVRRLASEGSRPRLPWAMALPDFKKNPEPVLPILEKLKEDPSLYVRRSVANNLNDISKDHPDLVVKIAQEWLGQNPNTDWLIKHACRGLLKQGLPKALQLFGYGSSENFKQSKPTLQNSNVAMGSSLHFNFSIRNQSKKTQKLRLEYGLYFLKKNGRHNLKVFKISERELSPGQEVMIEKSHSIKPITTRVYYEGEQYLSLIINGSESYKLPFQLSL